MIKFKFLVFGVFIVMFVGVVYVEGKFFLGVGVGVVEYLYKDYDIDVYLVSVINYEGDNFWFCGLGGGYYLWNDVMDKFLIIVYWSSFYFKVKDSGDY